MLNLYKISFIILLTLVIAPSCNIDNGVIQKRKYRKGYHISINHKIENNVADAQQKASTTKKLEFIPSSTNQEVLNTTLIDKKKNDLAEVENSQSTVVDYQKKTVTNIFSKRNKLKPVQKDKRRNNYLRTRISPSPISRKNIASKTVYASEIITAVVILVALIGAILAFQLIEGSLGIIIGTALIVSILVVLITLPFW